MLTCRDCQELILDYAYGLLEEGDSERVRAHAATCPTCQAELHQVDAGQQRTRRALRRDVPVPLFSPPDSDVLPLTPRREVARRHWPRFAAAAVLLLSAGLAYTAYSRGLSQRERALAEAKKKVDAQVARRSAFRQELPTELASVIRSAPHLTVRLQVFGPPTYHPGGVNDFRVVTTGLDGQSLPTAVKVRLRGKDGRAVYESQDQASQGNVLVSLPANLSRDEIETSQVEFSASARGVVARVDTALGVVQPAYTTHVGLSKSVYRPGEVILARSVTLDQYSLRPPPTPLKLTYVVTGPDRRPKRISGHTHDGGVGGAEYSVGDMWPDGEYSLTVSEDRAGFPPQTCRFYVRRPQSVRLQQVIRLDRGSYRPGETVQAELQAKRLDNGEPAAKEAVTVTLYVEDKAAGKPIDVRTDAAGVVRFQVQLPANVGAGAAHLSVLTGEPTERDSLVKVVPVFVPRVVVEFFPEGGDLAADVLNRVYVRARNPLGEPIDLNGQVIDGQGNEVAVVSLSGSRGVGMFSLLPRAGETYALRVAAPEGISDLSPLPEVHAGRVGLHVPAGVTRHPEPVRAILHHAGAPRSMLVGVFLRGRLVAHQPVQLQTGQNEVQLSPPAGAAGVLRVTVFDPQGPLPIPVAERLVYRVPNETLQLAYTPRKERYEPGERVQFDLHSRDEQNQLAASWLAVTVIHEAANRAARRSQKAYFHLLSEVRRPEDLELADVALGDEPEALTALDLHLGTQGWRRFAPAGDRPQAPQEDTILRLDTLDKLERKQADALASLASRLLSQDRDLAREQDRLAEEADATAAAVQNYREWTGRALGIGVRAALLTAFAGGCLLLLWGLVRVLGGSTARQPVFAGALAVMLLAAGGWLGASSWFDGGSPSGSGGVGTVQVQGWAVSPDLIARNEALPQWSPERLNGGDGKIPGSHLVSHGADGQPWHSGFHLSGSKPLIGQLVPGPAPAPGANKLPVRVHAYQKPMDGSAEKFAVAEVLLWHPLLTATEGTARVEFDLPQHGGTYRVLVHGHSPTGRLGVTQGQLEVPRR